MVINMGHEEIPEMLDDGSADVVSCNPFDNGLRFDVAQLLEGKFLKPVYKRVPISARMQEQRRVDTHVLYAFHVIQVPSLLVRPPRPPPGP